MDSKLKQAGYWRRTFAFLIDALFLILCTVIVYANLTSTYLISAMGGDKANEEMLQYAYDTGLYNMEETEEGGYRFKDGNGYLSYAAEPQSTTTSDSEGKEETVVTQEKRGYLLYWDAMWSYWTGFFLEDERAVPLSEMDAEGNEIELPRPTGTDDPNFASYGRYFSQEFMGLPELSEVEEATNWREYAETHEDWERNLSDGGMGQGKVGYYRYSLNEEGFVDYSLPPVLTSASEEGLSSPQTSAQWSSALLGHFYDPDVGEGCYFDLADWAIGWGDSPQSYYRERYDAINDYASYALDVAYAPFLFLFFYLIPALMRDGKTLGKAILRIAVVKREGTRIGPKERLLRPLVVLAMLSLIFIPNLWLSLMFLMLVVLLDFMLMILHKSHLTVEDMIFGTIVIDARESLWFRSEEEKERYLAAHPERSKSAPKTPEEEQLEKELQILDLSTIDARREEARRMTSFDAFEEEQDRLHKERIESIRAGTLPRKEEALSAEEEGTMDIPAESAKTSQNPSESEDYSGIQEEEAASAEVSEDKDEDSSPESDFADEGGDE